MLVMGRKERKPIVKPYIADREALSLARARAGWTLEEMETAANVSYTTISRIASGDIASPQWHTLEKLAGSVGLNPNTLVLWRDRDLEEQAKRNKEVIHKHFDNGPLAPEVNQVSGGRGTYPGGARTETDYLEGLDIEEEIRDEKRRSEGKPSDDTSNDKST